MTDQDQRADGEAAGSPILAILRAIPWLVVPISILVGDTLIRWDRGLAEQFTRENWSNLPASFLLSCGLWFAVALLISQLRPKERIVVGALAALLGGLAVVGIWQYNLVIHHDPNPGVIVYSLHEPGNAKKLAESGLTLSYAAMLTFVTLIWGSAIAATKIAATKLIRISAAVMLVGYVVSAAGWHDPSPEREAHYVSDVYFGVLVGTAVKRMVSYGNESALKNSNREDVEKLAPVKDAPNVLLFVGESLSRHRMSVYGAERKTTPYLDEWFATHEEGIVDFPNAWSASAFTPISVASMLTGLYPGRDHEMFHTKPVPWQWAHALGGESYLYATQMWTWSNLSLFFLAEHSPKHWATADEMEAPIVNDTGIDDRIAARALATELRSNPPTQRPSFMLYQTNATHFPLLAHEDPGFEVRTRRDEYDAAIRVVDESFQIVFEGLEKSGAVDDTVIVFMADHAEFDWDLVDSQIDGREIAVDLIDGERIESCHPTLAKVPFFVWVPPKWRTKLGPKFVQLQQNREQTVSLVDTLPTVLDLWGQPAPDYFDGTSLMQSVPEDRWVACFTNAPWTRWLMNGFAVIDADYFIYAREDFGEPQVFDPTSSEAIRYQLRGTAYEGEAKERLRKHVESSKMLQRYRDWLAE